MNLSHWLILIVREHNELDSAFWFASTIVIKIYIKQWWGFVYKPLYICIYLDPYSWLDWRERNISKRNSFTSAALACIPAAHSFHVAFIYIDMKTNLSVTKACCLDVPSLARYTSIAALAITNFTHLDEDRGNKNCSTLEVTFSPHSS